MSRSRVSSAARVAALVLAWAASAHAGLIAHWPFDGNASDVSGNAHHGTANANVLYSTNIPLALGAGRSLDLNGNAWVDVAADPALNSAAFTLSFWLNQDGAVQNGAHERTTSRQGDTFETALSSTSELNYYPGAAWVSTGYSLRASQWQHVAYVSTGSQMRVYVDGQQRYSGAFTGSPSGLMRIGARYNGVEDVVAMFDDVALWNTPLTLSEVRALHGGLATPETVDGRWYRGYTVLSDAARWSLSTTRRSGGAAGTWTGPFLAPPAAATFTLPAQASTTGNILAAASDIASGGTLLGDGGAGNPAGLLYYRTTFVLPPFCGVMAYLTLAADNGAEVFLNGVELARETSFLVENWQRPYSTLTINANGTISGTTLFDWIAPSFTGWLVGENEIILAVRNPDSEALRAGGIAFRMDITLSTPEPSGLTLLALGGLALARARRRRPEWRQDCLKAGLRT